MFQRSTTSECGVTQHTTTAIQYERYNTDGAKICSRKQRTKYDRRYDEEANRTRRRGSVSRKPERHTRENFHTHYDSSPLTFGRHEEPMRNLFCACTRNKKIETRRKISQSATICRIFLGGKLARSRSSSSSTQAITGLGQGFIGAVNPGFVVGQSGCVSEVPCSDLVRTWR